MNEFTRISIISTAEWALKKLKKEKIGVYNLKKDGARVYFSVKDKHIEKVFAIFSKPCYNVKVEKKSAKGALAALLRLRAGLAAGLAAFLVLAAAADMFVLKIEVGGSGSYLEPEILRIVYDEGARRYSTCRAFNKSVATGRILALPRVTFCNIDKRGSVLIIDVQVDDENKISSSREPLVSDVDGVIRNIVAVCGTAQKTVGDEVKKGDVLIAAYTVAGESRIDSIAAGYAEIECSAHSEYFSETDGDEGLKDAYASVRFGGEILTISHKIQPTEGGFIYVMDFTYLRRISINLT